MGITYLVFHVVDFFHHIPLQLFKIAYLIILTSVSCLSPDLVIALSPRALLFLAFWYAF